MIKKKEGKGITSYNCYEFGSVQWKKVFIGILVAMSSAIFFVSSYNTASAIPTLQLDISDGTYDPATETIISSSTSFTLYALLDPNSKNTLYDTYYISVALVPKTGPDGVSLGSLSFSGDTIEVTGDMVYGVPPLENIVTLQGWDSGDLPKHGIYETYFSEYEFQFSSYGTTIAYDAQDNAGDGPYDPDHTSPDTMYYAAFNVDTSLLDPDYSIHFDLYNTKLKSSGDIDVTQFAPFSHDAQSCTNCVPVSDSEPSTLILLSSVLVGLGLWVRWGLGGI